VLVAEIAVVVAQGARARVRGDDGARRQLEHVVDTVLSFEGDRHHALRFLRAVKHRFGATGELGIFEMTETGLVGVPDAGALLLHDRREDVSGSVVMPAMESHRCVLVEIQALLAASDNKNARRSVQGIDGARLAVILAVVEERLNRPLDGKDVYASAVGGVRVTEPAADLAIGLAVLSAQSGTALPPGVVAFGEVGLGGEVRQAGQTSQRLAEAARLGFTTAVVPASSPDGPPGMKLIKVHSLLEAARAMGLSAPSR